MTPLEETWQSVLKQRKKELLEGFFQCTYRGGEIYLGPVKDIKIKDGCLIIKTAWTAHLGAIRTGYKKVKGRKATEFRFTIDDGTSPRSEVNGVSWASIKPKACELWLAKKGFRIEGFDPSMVEGL